jgi:hypothetical protein
VLISSSLSRGVQDFGVRQAKILKEKPEQSFVRWIRITIRSAPMTAFILVRAPQPHAI